MPNTIIWTDRVVKEISSSSWTVEKEISESWISSWQDTLNQYVEKQEIPIILERIGYSGDYWVECKQGSYQTDWLLELRGIDNNKEIDLYQLAVINFKAKLFDNTGNLKPEGDFVLWGDLLAHDHRVDTRLLMKSELHHFEFGKPDIVLPPIVIDPEEVRKEQAKIMYQEYEKEKSRIKDIISDDTVFYDINKHPELVNEVLEKETILGEEVIIKAFYKVMVERKEKLDLDVGIFELFSTGYNNKEVI